MPYRMLERERGKRLAVTAAPGLAPRVIEREQFLKPR